jgi:hypothetical protein
MKKNREKNTPASRRYPVKKKPANGTALNTRTASTWNGGTGAGLLFDNFS